MKKNIYIVFTLSVLFAFGCSSETEKAKTETNTAVNAPANAVVEEPLPDIDITKPFAPSDDPKMDLINSTKRLQEHDSWSATLENNLYPEMKTELEYVKPDRYHIKNPVSEVIVVGSEGYVKNKDGWQRLDEDVESQIQTMRKSLNAEGMKNIKEVSKSGTEKIDGKDALAYSYSINTGQTGLQNKTKVWIANDTGLPLKILVETQNADALQKITTTYNYTKQVKIEAPKVKAGTENSQK